MSKHRKRQSEARADAREVALLVIAAILAEGLALPALHHCVATVAPTAVAEVLTDGN